MYSLFIKNLILSILRFYKFALSPCLGQCCRFYPSCADYACEALTHYGVIKGGWLAIKRLCRCHPFSRGGIDYIPPITSSKSKF